jgi:hypothetical protein
MVPHAAPSSTKAVRLEKLSSSDPHHYARPYTVDDQSAWSDPIQVPAADRLFRFSAIDAMQYNGAPLVEWRGADGRTVDLCR